jgi:CofD-related protein of GAK system
MARLPDSTRVDRCRRTPELGPRILFFSGGSALREVSRELKSLTHNSIHLMPPFDAGGSSARLREAFGMLSVGDLRNRLMALADESALGSPEIYALFSHRLSAEASAVELRGRLDDLVDGSDARIKAVPEPMRRIVQTHLRFFAERMPADFDLRNASLGNLVIAGGYLENDGDIDSVIFLFSKLVRVRGQVRPVVDADLHLAATLADGSEVLGQHRLTGKEVAPIRAQVTQLRLVAALDDPTSARVSASERVCAEIRSADVLCFPMGSFYSSVIANLLPDGIATAICAAECPKVYVPNLGSDPEQFGLSVGAATERLVETVRREAGPQVPIEQILNAVFVDSAAGEYALPPELDRVRALGIDVIDLPLANAGDSRVVDPRRLAEFLVSLA